MGSIIWTHESIVGRRRFLRSMTDLSMANFYAQEYTREVLGADHMVSKIQFGDDPVFLQLLEVQRLNH